MNEKTPPDSNNAPAPSDAESNGPLAGQRLANARRENDISISEIAKELHLDEPRVQALEENLFDELGAPVFAKGHLRKYAELVGVPTDDVLADYYKLNRSTGAPPVVGPRRPKPPTDISLGPWIAGIVAVALIAAVSYWWLNRVPTPEASTAPGILEPFESSRGAAESEPEPTPPAAEDISSSDATEADATDAAATDAAAELEVATPAIEPAVDQGPVAAATEGQLQIAMTYSGDCWTEVTDANGERLFFGLGQAGQKVTRNGIPPFQALFGDASNVSVTVDGIDFPVSGRAGRGNTARVTINGQ
jgi:cytoskeleton protein RodZ